MALTRAELSALLPHAGAMSLLHEVEQYDGETIACRAVSHRNPDNPLRERGMLHAVSAIEYAAQAMALHGALCDGCGARPGMLAAVRDVALHVERLDDVEDDLTISARRIVAERDRLIYNFSVHAQSRALVSGRAIVVRAPQKSQ